LGATPLKAVDGMLNAIASRRPNDAAAVQLDIACAFGGGPLTRIARATVRVEPATRI
jgi:hypothetical protein